VKVVLFGSFGLTIIGVVMMFIAFAMVGYNMTPR
jgi:hypothetical protein